MNWRTHLPLLGIVALGALGLTGCNSDNGTEPVVEVPGAPTGVSATVDGTSVTVSWTGGADATSFRVELTAPGESTRSETVTGATTVTFTGLSKGKTYTAQVFAVNSVGETAGSVAVAEIPEEEPNVILVTDQILDNTTWETGKTYVLRGPIFVGNDIGADGTKSGGKSVTLTIQPGVTVLGDPNPPAGTRASYLAVARGSRIIADANANRTDKNARPNPEDVIVFTSRTPRGTRTRLDWGGLIINGRAPINTGAEAEGEGDTGFYGGNVPDDDSGIYRGVRIEFCGDRVTTTDELNCFAPQGVGSGTIIDYVQTHYGSDDGFEPFGGTASMTHLVSTGISDDSFDGTDGYRGFMQFGIAQQRQDESDQGFELSTNADNPAASPQSTAVIANFTMIGSHYAQGTAEITNVTGATTGASDWGIMLREGSNYRIFNSIVTGFDGGFCVETDQTAVNANNRLGGSSDPSTTLRVESTVLWNNDGVGAGDNNFKACEAAIYSLDQNKTFFTTAGFNNMLADPLLPATAFSIGSQSNPPNVIPTGIPAGYVPFDPSSLNGQAGLVMPQHTGFNQLVQTNYPGAVAPGTALADAWYYGWTIWSVDGTDSRPNDSGN